MPPSRQCLDSRDMKAAYVVSDENGYYDSQNIISVYDRNIGVNVLSCVLHHSRNHEGGKGLTLCSTRSVDGGKTWSGLVPVEEPETEVDCQAYGVEKRDPGARQSHDGYQLLVGERIYLFYGWNVGSQPPVGDKISRTDMQLEEGFWMRWSDDYGVTFSGGRVLIPVRRTAIDRSNPWQGPTMGAFCCDKPTIIDGMVYFAFQKTVDGNGESYGSEVFFMRSRDLLQLHVDNRPEAATWDTLPLGDDGLQTPRGLLLGEEPHVIQISGSKLLCLWRTELGFFDTRVSDDYGETWSGGSCPVPLGYSGSGGHVSIMGMANGATSGERRVVQSVAGAVVRNTDLIVDSGQYLQSAEYRDLVTTNHDVMRNVRGAFTPAKLRDGSIVMLYYNNGHTDKLGYVGRLVVWLTMGRVDGDTIVWSQPEIALWWDGIQLDSREDWNEDWAIVDGAGYHDIQELPDGCVVFVESNKLTVRYHTIDKDIIHWLRHQLQCPVSTKAVSPSDAVLTWTHGADPSMRAPVLPDLRSGAGFSLAISLNTSHLPDNTIVLVDGMSTVSGSLDEEDAEDITKGFKIVAGEGQLKILLTDGFGINFEFQIENLNAEHLRRHYGLADSLMRISFVLDGGPKVCSVVINQKLYNPAPSGWKFLPREFGEIGGSNVKICDKVVTKFLVFDRALLTSECMALHGQ